MKNGNHKQPTMRLPMTSNKLQKKTAILSAVTPPYHPLASTHRLVLYHLHNRFLHFTFYQGDT